MQDIIDRLKKGLLEDFSGGVKPVENKSQSLSDNIATLALPSVIYIPVRQHIGSNGDLLVKVGDRVLKGQPLTRSKHPFAVPVHASTSGYVVNIGPHVSPHPSGIPQLTVQIEPDGQEEWLPLNPVQDYTSLSKLSLLERLCQSGIAGLGGAGFPTHIKLSTDKQVELLVINGVECEPYITSDDMLMCHHGEEIIQGIQILVHLLSPKQVVIAIEDNKPDAFKKLQALCPKDFLVVSIPTKYPAGGEKQLIQLLTGKEIPIGQLPIDIGILMQNVGTCFAIANAIINGKPLISRVVTVTGGAVSSPANYWVNIGTPMQDLADQAQYQAKKQATPNIIMGGPMMGFNIHSFQTPVVKTTNCVLLLSDEEAKPHQQEMACIRCGACADACPAKLLPQQLYWYSRAKDFEKANEYQLSECIECGACAYVCPSHIPLVQYYRQAKSDIKYQESEKQKSEQARIRFEARKVRLEEEKRAREEKHKKAAEARLNRTQRNNEETPSNSSAQTKAVMAAIQRAKAKKSEQNQVTELNSNENATVNNSNENDKKDRVAAAIARAKAKKAAQSLTEDTPSDDTATLPSTEEDKKARVAAAVAKAKAREKKAQQNSEPEKDKGTDF